MMSFADITSPQQLAAVLSQQHQIAYAVLFLGALFETLIPFSLAVLGEIFFLSGALLAGMGVLDLWAVMAVLYAGGILGDNLSYWIGRRYGSSLFDRLAHWPLVGRLIHAENYQRGMAFFHRRGAMAVFTARLSGPLSWVMPAMAGVFRLDYRTFLRFNTLGVIIGIGEFIVVGYFFGAYLSSIRAWFDQFSVVITITAAIILGSCGWWYYFVYRRAKNEQA
jgi:membrane-associated protein